MIIVMEHKMLWLNHLAVVQIIWFTYRIHDIEIASGCECFTR